MHKDLAAGASSVIAAPISPTMPALPVSTLARRERKASESSRTVMAEKGSVSAMAVLQMNAHFGDGAIDEHDGAHHHADRAAHASTPCDANLASSANRVKASSSSAAPSQLMGSTDMAESPSNTRMAPTTPGAIMPRRGELDVNAHRADHQQHQRDIRIGDGGDDRLAQRLLVDFDYRAGGVRASACCRRSA